VGKGAANAIFAGLKACATSGVSPLIQYQSRTATKNTKDTKNTKPKRFREFHG